MVLSEGIEKANKLLVYDNAINLGEVEDIGNVILLQAVIHRHNHCPSGDNPKDGLKKGWSVGGKDADAPVSVLLEIVGEAPGAVGKLGVGAAEDGAVDSDVKDGLCVGLDCGGAL